MHGKKIREKTKRNSKGKDNIKSMRANIKELKIFFRRKKLKSYIHKIQTNNEKALKELSWHHLAHLKI